MIVEDEEEEEEEEEESEEAPENEEVRIIDFVILTGDSILKSR